MKKIIIIGGGFAGLSALRILSRRGLGLEVVLIDRKDTFDFLPALPDAIGRGIKLTHLTCKIEETGRKNGFKFVKDEVDSIDTGKNEVLTRTRRFNYDYLIIASGSETNFYGNKNIAEFAFKLDEAMDAEKIIEALKNRKFDNYIIGGGGYTGIELATNLSLFLTKNKKSGKIIIVERAPAILGPLTEWMKNYVTQNLKSLNVDILVNSSLEKLEDSRAYVTGGKVFNRAMVIWAAGVKTSGFIQDLKADKNPQGRLQVDEYLRLSENCFAVGDAAFVSYRCSNLRMAVQFSIAQGSCAALNVIDSIKGEKLHKYIPRDLGFIIPMANNKSCGNVFGVQLKGILPTILHFTMCIYRSCCLKNQLGILRDLITGGVK